jgi:hypothetical protein
VSSQIKDAFAAAVRTLVIFKAVVDNHLSDVLFGISREKAYLSQLPANRSKGPAQNLPPFRFVLIWERKLKISHAHAAQSAVQQVDQPSEQDGYSARDLAWQNSNAPEQQPEQSIFETLAHARGTHSSVEKTANCRKINRHDDKKLIFPWGLVQI